MICTLSYIPLKHALAYYEKVILHKLDEKSEAAEDTMPRREQRRMTTCPCHDTRLTFQ
jgi:hypothetical protein